MATVAHTPGPWSVEDPLGDEAGDSLWIIQDTNSGEVVDWRNLALVCSDHPDDADTARPISPDERDANARLIAAAPELLEALEEAREALFYYKCQNGWRMTAIEHDVVSKAASRANDAIAKARGEA